MGTSDLRWIAAALRLMWLDDNRQEAAFDREWRTTLETLGAENLALTFSSLAGLLLEELAEQLQLPRTRVLEGIAVRALGAEGDLSKSQF